MANLTGFAGPMITTPRPSGRVPPGSAADLLERYAAGERGFAGADLSGTLLRCLDLSGADLRDASLLEADLCGANLDGANLDGADLRLARLRGVSLRGASLRGALLRGARLLSADLRGADLSAADLAFADLRGADLGAATLVRAVIDQTLVAGTSWGGTTIGGTVIDGVNLARCLRLAEVIHAAPSDLGMSTLLLSRGRIPSAFVRGCGLSEWDNVAAVAAWPLPVVTRVPIA